MVYISKTKILEALAKETSQVFFDIGVECWDVWGVHFFVFVFWCIRVVFRCFVFCYVGLAVQCDGELVFGMDSSSDPDHAKAH